jgi:hypothetical protein
VKDTPNPVDHRSFQAENPMTPTAPKLRFIRAGKGIFEGENLAIGPNDEILPGDQEIESQISAPPPR